MTTSSTAATVEEETDSAEPSEFSELTAEDNDDDAVVLPNPSPRKGVMGSFLGRVQSPRRTPATTTPVKLSPAAKGMGEILERSRDRLGRDGKDSGPRLPGSVRRRLLEGEGGGGGDGEEVVAVTPPPAKKQRLLTEHQKEKLREKSTIPALYNTLDASQDVSQPPFSEESQSVPERCVCKYYMK